MVENDPIVILTECDSTILMVNNEMFLLDPTRFPFVINVFTLLDQNELNVPILLHEESDKIIQDAAGQCSGPRFCKQLPAAPNLEKYFMLLVVLTQIFLVSFSSSYFMVK